MQLLSSCPITHKFLYRLMTDSTTVKGKYYREEITALYNAKSIATAIAMYYYITNPQNSYWLDNSTLDIFDFINDDAVLQALDHC